MHYIKSLLWVDLTYKWNFPDGSANLPVVQETLDMQVRSLGEEDPLEEEIATHSSILACKILWTEDPGRLQSIGSQELDTTEHAHTYK